MHTRHFYSRAVSLLFVCGVIASVILLAIIAYGKTKIGSNLREAGIEYETLTINPVAGSIILEKVQGLSSAGGQTIFLDAQLIAIRGIKLIPLIFSDELKIKTVSINQATLRIMPATNTNEKVAARSPGIQRIAIETIGLNNVTAQYKMDSILFEGVITMEASGFDLHKGSSVDRPLDLFLRANGTINQARVIPRDSSYSYHANAVTLIVEDGMLNLGAQDVRVIPGWPKFEFAHHMGRQTDRIIGTIDSISITGTHIHLQPDDSTKVSVTLEHMIINRMNLHVFRDKRLAFKAIYKPLPMTSLNNLPIHLSIARISIPHAAVTYEEFPDNGERSGTVTFNNIHANLENIRTNSSAPATMEATAQFMDSGELTASFTFPCNGSDPYTVTGVLRKMHLIDANAFLIPLANIEIESGEIPDMEFTFGYTENTSTGNLMINYKDLSFIVLTESSKRKNELFSFLANLLVRPRKTGGSAKQSGAINIPRDTNRFIFNLWAKSITDGIKSSFIEK